MSDPKPIENSYYHGRKITTEEEAVRFKPQKVDTPVETPAESTATTKSKWNAAGTFETTDLSKDQIQSTLNQIYTPFGSALSTDAFQITITSVTFEGYASTMFTRNKRGLGFELTVKLNWTAVVDEEEIANGTITFDEVDFASISDFDIKYSTSDKNDQYLTVVKTLRSQEKALRKSLSTWVDAMLQLE